MFTHIPESESALLWDQASQAVSYISLHPARASAIQHLPWPRDIQSIQHSTADGSGGVCVAARRADGSCCAMSLSWVDGSADPALHWVVWSCVDLPAPCIALRLCGAGDQASVVALCEHGEYVVLAAQDRRSPQLHAGQLLPSTDTTFTAGTLHSSGCWAVADATGYVVCGRVSGPHWQDCTVDAQLGITAYHRRSTADPVQFLALSGTRELCAQHFAPAACKAWAGVQLACARASGLVVVWDVVPCIAQACCDFSVSHAHRSPCGVLGKPVVRAMVQPGAVQGLAWLPRAPCGSLMSAVGYRPVADEAMPAVGQQYEMLQLGIVLRGSDTLERIALLFPIHAHSAITAWSPQLTFKYGASGRREPSRAPGPPSATLHRGMLVPARGQELLPALAAVAECPWPSLASAPICGSSDAAAVMLCPIAAARSGAYGEPTDCEPGSGGTSAKPVRIAEEAWQAAGDVAVHGMPWGVALALPVPAPGQACVTVQPAAALVVLGADSARCFAASYTHA